MSSITTIERSTIRRIVVSSIYTVNGGEAPQDIIEEVEGDILADLAEADITLDRAQLIRVYAKVNDRERVEQYIRDTRRGMVRKQISDATRNLLRYRAIERARFCIVTVAVPVDLKQRITVNSLLQMVRSGRAFVDPASYSDTTTRLEELASLSAIPGVSIKIEKGKEVNPLLSAVKKLALRSAKWHLKFRQAEPLWSLEEEHKDKIPLCRIEEEAEERIGNKDFTAKVEEVLNRFAEKEGKGEGYKGKLAKTLWLRMDGLTEGEVANRLKVTERSVRTYVKDLKKAFGEEVGLNAVG